MINESRGLRSIPVVGRTSEDYVKLTEFLNEKEFEIQYIVSDITEGEHIPAIMIDMINHTASITSVMIMACWCTGGRQPISVETFIDNYEEIVINQNSNLYNFLVDNSNKKVCN